MQIVAVVADANVLLSAVIGKAALRVLTQHKVKVHASRFNAAEVERYLPRLCAKYRMPEKLVAIQWRLLPVSFHPVEDYAMHMQWAVALLEDRDPDDAHPLALSRALGLPLWSNDRDLQIEGIRCFPTAHLLKLLESER